MSAAFAVGFWLITLMRKTMPTARSVLGPAVPERLAQEELLAQVSMDLECHMGQRMCWETEPCPPVVRQFLAHLPGIQRLTLCITNVSNDAEEVVLHSLLFAVSFGVDLFHL